MNWYCLDTPRLQLRLITPEQWQEIYSNRNEQEIRELLDLTAQEYFKHKRRVEGGLVSWDRRFAYFQLILRETGRVIGSAGFHNWFPEHRRAEIGYVLDEDIYKKQGYMTEAMGALLPYGFDELQLHRIEAHVEPGNIPSLRLLQRFGFIQEGLLRQHYFYEGMLQDSLLFALVKSG
jgi:ribosomal-protein-alanine N-acetyltransferase